MLWWGRRELNCGKLVERSYCYGFFGYRKWWDIKDNWWELKSLVGKEKDKKLMFRLFLGFGVDNGGDFGGDC